MYFTCGRKIRDARLKTRFYNSRGPACIKSGMPNTNLLYVPPGLTFINSAFCPQCIYVFLMDFRGKTAIISLYSINWLVFRTEAESVYCAVRTGYLNQTYFVWI